MLLRFSIRYKIALLNDCKNIFSSIIRLFRVIGEHDNFDEKYV